jgi:hypothetical protein
VENIYKIVAKLVHAKKKHQAILLKQLHWFAKQEFPSMDVPNLNDHIPYIIHIIYNSYSSASPLL